MSSTTGRLGPTRTIAAAVAVVMALYHLYVIVPPLDFISPSLREVFRGPPTEFFFRGGHLLFALVLTFLWFRRASPNEEDLAAMLPDERQRVLDANRNGTIVDWCLVALSVLTIVYVFWNYDYIINRIIYVDDPHWMDMVLCVVLVCLLLEATRRLMGLALPITALGFLAYAFIFAKVSPTGLVDQLYLSTEGIFGQPLAVSAAYVMIFVLFGAFMEKTGTGQLFMDFAMSLTGHTAGGPGKVSVVSSSLFGTISGSAVANVMVDGPISIPLMKRTGFPAHFAAAVEAVASTGGQIMPPIMGAAAFVMAEFLGVGYGQVVIWALIPSVLYYLACFGAVHFEAKRLGIVGVPRSELPVLTRVLAERGHLFLPVIILLTIMYAGYSSPLAALAGTLLCFPVAYLRASTRPNVTFKNFIEALIDGSRNTLAVALACACAGVIIGTVTLTGLGIVFSQWVVGLSQNTLLLALVLTMMAGIVLGMGMPTTPAYIIMVSLLVPAIIKLGVPKPAAHMFAFYFAILSAITPPVALAVYAASGLAKSDVWATGWAAMKIGAAGFIVPFMFVYEPALLMIGTWPQVIQAVITASIGILFLAAGLHGYLIGPANSTQKALLIASCFCLVNPNLLAGILPPGLAAAGADVLGLGLAGVVVLWQLATRKAAAAQAA